MEDLIKLNFFVISRIFKVPITLTTQVFIGSLKDLTTNGWAAKWKTISGFISFIYLSNFSLSLISQIIWFKSSFILSESSYELIQIKNYLYAFITAIVCFLILNFH